MESDLTPAALEASGVPTDLVDGMILARGHYGEFDTENYRVGVLQGLSMATCSDILIESPPAAQPTLEQSSDAPSPVAEKQASPTPTGEIADVLLETIRAKDDGGGVDYDTLVHAAVTSGHSR